MKIHRTVKSVASVALAATLVTGCSAIADKAGEKVAEKGMEAAGGGDVDIDSDGDGKVSIESDEGSLEIGGSELPDDFPVTIYFIVLPLEDTATVRKLADDTLKAYQKL